MYTADELAEKLKVSRRTVFRYLTSLRDAGYFFDVDDQNRYWRVLDTNARVRDLEFEELVTVLFCARSATLAQHPKVAFILKQAWKHLSEIVDMDIQHRVNSFFRSCVVEPGPSTLPKRQTDLFAELLLAKLRSRAVYRIRYRTVSGETAETELTPNSFNAHESGYTIGGMSSSHRGIRCFDLDQLIDIERLEPTCVDES